MTTHPTALTPTLTEIKVHDAMRPGVSTCRAEDGLATVAATIVGRGIHAMLVEPPASGNPLILTDLELIRAALQRPHGASAGEVASEPFTAIPSDAPLDQAVATMAERYLAHLLAVDPASGAAFGVISSFDVVNALGGHEPFEARTFRAKSAPAAAGPTLSDARAAEVMHPGVVTCAPDAPLWAVARSMAEHRIHCIAVAGVGDAGAHARHFSWGLVDDMNLVLAAHRGALTEAAATIATTAPPAVNEGDPLQRAAELMVSDQTRHVVVVGRSGVPSGMISTLDVIRTLAGAT